MIYSVVTHLNRLSSLLGLWGYVIDGVSSFNSWWHNLNVSNIVPICRDMQPLIRILQHLSHFFMSTLDLSNRIRLDNNTTFWSCSLCNKDRFDDRFDNICSDNSWLFSLFVVKNYYLSFSLLFLHYYCIFSDFFRYLLHLCCTRSNTWP